MCSQIAFRLAAIVIGLAIPLIGLEIILRMLPVNEGSYLEPVNESNPIWHFKPNRTFTYSSGWDFSIVNSVHSNNYGFLHDEDYQENLSSPLLAVIGDSYVEAIMVPFAETLTGRLVRHFDGSLRVYGFARSGAPLSQYLVYSEFANTQFGADRMIFVIVENDFDQSFEQYHYEGGHHHFLDTDEGEIQLKRNDVSLSLTKQIARKSALLRYLILNLRISQFPDLLKELLFQQEDYEAVSVNSQFQLDPARIAYAKKAVDWYFEKLPSMSNLEPEDILFLIDGIRTQIYDQEDAESTPKTYEAIMREYFVSAAGEHGYEIIDLHPHFERNFAQRGNRFDYPTDSHWNELGHEVAYYATIGSDMLRWFVQEYAQLGMCEFACSLDSIPLR